MTGRETKLPGIPQVPVSVAPEVRRFLGAMKEALEVRLGVRGDPLDAAPTLRTLADGGVIGLRQGPNGFNVVPGDSGSGGGTDDGTGDIPPAPQNLRAYGGMAIITVTWDAPTYSNHAVTQIWRNNKNDLGTALQVAEVQGNYWVDNVARYARFFYWARFKNTAGVVGPFNSREGTAGETATDPEYILDLLAGQLTENQLYQDLGSRIDLIDVTGTGLIDRVTQTENSVETLSTQMALLIPADPYATGTAYAVGDQVTYSGSLYTCILAFTPPPEQAPTNATYWEKVMDVVEISAAIQTLETTIASVESTVASQITTVQTQVGANTAAVQSVIESINGIEAKYEIKLDVNGHVSGFGLMATPQDSGVTSQFIIRADAFYVAPPSYVTGNLAPQQLFAVQASPGNLTLSDGTVVNVPAGVYMNQAYIANGSITNAKIGEFIQSSDYVPNIKGWRLQKGDASKNIPAKVLINGNLEVRNSSGQLIFGSSQQPLGALASQNSTTLGLNAFGHGSLALLNNIPNATYIANGIINNAHIGNAQITTLKIAGQAVMVPHYAANKGDQVVGTGVILVVTIVVGATGLNENHNYVVSYGFRARGRTVANTLAVGSLYVNRTDLGITVGTSTDVYTSDNGSSSATTSFTLSGLQSYSFNMQVSVQAGTAVFSEKFMHVSLVKR